MRHEDFVSLELDDVLPRILKFCHENSRCQAVHWLSAVGFEHIRKSQKEDSIFASAEVIGTHMWSHPVVDMYSLLPMWRQVDELLEYPRRKGLAPLMLNGSRSQLIYPYFNGERFLGALVLDGPGVHNPVQLIADIQPDLNLAAKYLGFAYTHVEAKHMSYLDELTGLYNQRYLPMALEHEIERCKREKSVFSLLFLDIDFFKNVNDGRGHWVGSKLLIELGRILKSQVRTCDYAFRYGGDEFVILLGNSSIENSKKVAERIRKAVEGSTFAVEGHSLNLTVSIGLAGFPDHAQTAAGLIQIADQAMYYGKRKSRNIVFVAS